MARPGGVGLGGPLLTTADPAADPDLVDGAAGAAHGDGQVGDPDPCAPEPRAGPGAHQPVWTQARGTAGTAEPRTAPRRWKRKGKGLRGWVGWGRVGGHQIVGGTPREVRSGYGLAAASCVTAARCAWGEPAGMFRAQRGDPWPGDSCSAETCSVCFGECVWGPA